MINKKMVPAIVSILLVILATDVLAAKWNDRSATRDYYNAQAKLPWDKRLGDWKDAEGTSWGDVPFTTEAIVKQPFNGKVRFNVTPLLNFWASSGYKNEGFFLRGLRGGSKVNFHSRESTELSSRPQLIVSTNLSDYNFTPSADTYLTASTTSALGTQGLIKIGRSGSALISFDLGKLGRNETVNSAFLELTVQKIYSPKLLEIGVFQVAPAPSSSPVDLVKELKGIASNYPNDKGIGDNLAVFYANGFEDWDWQKGWTDGGKMGEVVSQDNGNLFQALSGKALLVNLPEGGRVALNQKYKFSANGIIEPEEAYFRYYLRLGDNWDQTISSGKMPGFAGTYNVAGWGGRKPNGENGWSTRGSFLKTIRQGSEKVTPMGSYVYHLDQHGSYGSIWTWNRSGGALLKNNQWYCIEQYVKLNTPGESDAVLRVWLDGHKVFEKKDLQFRTSRTLKIEEVWMNIYHGGMARSVTQQTAYIDNFVVARKYIGPINNQ